MATLQVTNLQNTAATVTNVSLLADGSTTLVLNATGTSRTGGLRYNAGNLEVYTSGGVWASAGGGGGTVTGVTASLPLVSTGGTAPVLSINAATNATPGSMSAADKAKLDGAATIVSAVTGTAPISVATGSTTPVVSITPGINRQLLETNGGVVGFASNIDIPGTLDVTGVSTFDAQAVHVAGTAAAPSVTFVGDLNTGVYAPAADNVATVTGGLEAYRTDASQRLLIGKTAADGPALLQLNGGYNILKGFTRRPPMHRGPLFTKTGANTVSIVADAALNGYFYNAATAVTMPALSANTDYAIWQHPATGALVGDASFTVAPAGTPGGTIVGGFHYIPAGRPTGFNNASPTGAAEILEYSIWDLSWRPTCPDPRGMTCILGGYWMDLYICGTTAYAGNTFSVVPSSRFGVTLADGVAPPLIPAEFGGNGTTAYGDGKWYTFTEVATSFGKSLPSYGRYSEAAFGVLEATSVGADPGTVTWTQVSKFGLAQAAGSMSLWGNDTATTVQPTAFTTGTQTNGRGQVYGPETRAVILAGVWNDGSNSGSRYASWNGAPWSSGASSLGARFSAEHLVVG